MRYCTKYYRTSWRCAPGLGEIWDILRLETDLELSTDMVVDALPPKIKIEKQNKKSWSELSLGRACSAEYSFCKRKDEVLNQLCVPENCLVSWEIFGRLSKRLETYPVQWRANCTDRQGTAMISYDHTAVWEKLKEPVSTGWGLRDSPQTAWKNSKERIMLTNKLWSICNLNTECRG